MVDPVTLTQNLIRCPSVTPDDAGALDVVETVLKDAGFSCQRIPRAGIDNLFARWGTGRTLGFNGHTDVVPTGDAEAWSDPPFDGALRDGYLFGRGACDMKSGVAAFVAAAVNLVSTAPPDGSIVLAITGDEEGDATDGTAAILDWMDTRGEKMDACIVGEPTSREQMGDMIKIGRRGSMTAYITATGQQGHSAYPHKARNPLPVLVGLLDTLARHTLDEGSDHFDASTLAITTVDTGNPANNVIPGEARATLNIRFNDRQSSATLINWIDTACNQAAADTGVRLDVRYKVSGESFITEPGPLSDIVAQSVAAVTGRDPVLSTSGGTSDARFVRSHCPVVECGLVGDTMHQVDERVAVDQIHQLTDIYTRIIKGFFAEPGAGAT